MSNLRKRLALLILIATIAACGGGAIGEGSTTTSAVGQAPTTTKPPLVTTTLTTAASTTTTDGATATTSGTTTTGVPTVSTTLPDNDTQVPDELLAAVLADAASRSGLDASTFVVASGEAVDWADSSLGCPEPGMGYMQVITPGYRVVLTSGATSLEYHLNQRGDFAQCTGGVSYPPSDY